MSRRLAAALDDLEAALASTERHASYTDRWRDERRSRAAASRMAGDEPGTLDRARALIERAERLQPYWLPEVRRALGRVGDALQREAQTLTEPAVSAAKSLAARAYALVRGPLLILALLWLWSKRG